MTTDKLQFNIIHTDGLKNFYGEINDWYMLFGIRDNSSIELGAVIGINIKTLPLDLISHVIEIARPAIQKARLVNSFTKN